VKYKIHLLTLSPLYPFTPLPLSFSHPVCVSPILDIWVHYILKGGKNKMEDKIPKFKNDVEKYR
ncbi:MAG: hypothetical protein U9N34_01375, partial [Candidatus Cloacimonadota bacterium]|nr:hypothetical protein [Candidatus Cloacimonadota bacterium]